MDYLNDLPDEIVLKIIKRCIYNLHYRQVLKIITIVSLISKRFSILVDDIKTGKRIIRLKNQYKHVSIQLGWSLYCLITCLGEVENKDRNKDYCLSEMKKFIYQGANINIIAGDNLGEGTPTEGYNCTALILAIICKDEKLASYLIDNGADITIRDSKYDFSALQFAASVGCLEVVKKLIAKNDNINYLNKKNVTALMQAAYNDKIEIVKLLIEHKAELDHVDSKGISALLKAAVESHLEIVKLLLEAGANVKMSISKLDIIDNEQIRKAIVDRYILDLIEQPKIVPEFSFIWEMRKICLN